MPRTRPTAAAALLAAASIAAPAASQSDELFVFTLTEQGNPGNTITVGGSSLPDLVSDLGDTTGEFDSFDGLPFDATIDYGGVQNAVDVSYDPAGGSGGGEILTINNLLGFGGPITFDSADGDIGEQLEDFFLGSGDEGDAIEQFLAALAAESLIAATDGNPLATTARSARYSFFRYGLFSDITPTDRELRRIHTDPLRTPEGAPPPNEEALGIDATDPSADGLGSPAVFSPNGATELDYGFARFRLDFRGQTVEADSFDGPSFDLALSTEVRFHDRVSAVIGVPLAYHSIGGGDVYNAGLHAGLPIRLLIPNDDDWFGIKWQVTPFGGADAVFSYDLASGGVLYNFGVNNVIQFDLGPVAIVTSQQYTFHESLTLEADDFSIDPSVDQQILKLGAKAQLGLSDNVYVYGGGVWTDFIEDAAVDNYTTALAGAGIRTSNGFNLLIGYEGDFGDDYEAHGGSLTMQLPF